MRVFLNRAFLVSLTIHVAFAGLLLRSLSATNAKSPIPVSLGEIGKPKALATVRSVVHPLDSAVSTEILESAPTTETNKKSAESGGSALIAETPWIARIRTQIEARLIYPRSLQRRKIEGKVILNLTVQKDGSLSSAEILESSGIADLDHAALEAVNRATPFSELADLSGPLQIKLPVEFKIKNR